MSTEDHRAMEQYLDAQHSEIFIRHNLPRFVAAREFGAYGVLLQFELLHAAKTSLAPDLFGRFCTRLRTVVGSPEIVAGSPEVETMCKFGSTFILVRNSPQDPQSSTSSHLHRTRISQSTPEEALTYSEVDVNDLREAFVRSHLGRG